MDFLKVYKSRLQSALNANIPWSEKGKILFAIAKAQVITDRQREAEIKIDFYEGDQADYVTKYIKEKFKEHENLLRLLDWYNITKLIVDKISNIYASPATRTLINDKSIAQKKAKVKIGEEPKEVKQDVMLAKQQELFDEIMSLSNWREFMTTVNTYTNICNEVMVRPFFFDAQGIIKLDLLTPDVVLPLPNDQDPTELEGVIFQKRFYDDFSVNKDNDPSVIYHIWTATDYSQFTEDKGEFTPRPIEENTEGVNPYGILPIAISRNKIAIDRIFSNDGKDLINLQYSINRLILQINELTLLQSFAVPVLTGWDKMEGDILISPGVPLVLPPNDKMSEQTAGFAYVTPDSKISELEAQLKAKLERVAMVYNIAPSEFQVQGSPASGYAIRLMNKGLEQMWHKQNGFYESMEQRTAKIVMKIWNYHRHHLTNDSPLAKYKAIQFADDTRLNCITSVPNFPSDPIEARERLDWEIRHNLNNYVSYMIKEYGLSESEAIATIEKNRQVNEQYKPAPAEDPFDDEGKAIGDNKKDDGREFIGKVKEELLDKKPNTEEQDEEE